MSRQSCLIIAGEKSGEDHALSFFKGLKDKTPNTDYFGVGGDKLEALGVDLMYHYKDFSSMGLTDVLRKLPFYKNAFKKIVKRVKEQNVKTAILIDFQGFNLKLAKTLKKMDVNVLYYVAPQAWVWKAWRAKTLEKCVHTLFTILPFEKKWFEDRGVKRIKPVTHPLIYEYGDKLGSLRHKSFDELNQRKKRILLLPGSRRFEVEGLLPVFIEALNLVRKEVSDIEVGIVKVSSVSDAMKSLPKDIKVWDSDDLIKACDWADVCMAASGTVTLATGIFSLPTVVAYKLSMVNEFIFRSIITYDGPVSLTNIIHGDYVYDEHLHYRADRYNISKTIIRLLTDREHYNSKISTLSQTKDLLDQGQFDIASYMAEVINE
ncbi:MAG: lipid-A-disaccharide synthase [Bacteriovoracaceae bacterium]|jgi:lipid-A-disaccharide synthase|nr:lipid-A-disaccharide synthase [Bacteriovoracaceae bacterium]